ncbi:hypothetical protein M011DRAFT_467862 [Sporormia fimetaria CBS 119925]|uniref:Uncharacterized protein n=1 Tax=Sporormia fimetaria CBS 119925 TaxID=1340428 RepID=A0A6A6VC95_9PLEO|nr:hypothetical protein M011DRAFT_467862 [Sporormia fimetaria CBS 119925]
MAQKNTNRSLFQRLEQEYCSYFFKTHGPRGRETCNDYRDGVCALLESALGRHWYSQEASVTTRIVELDWQQKRTLARDLCGLLRANSRYLYEEYVPLSSERQRLDEGAARREGFEDAFTAKLVHKYKNCIIARDAEQRRSFGGVKTKALDFSKVVSANMRANRSPESLEKEGLTFAQIALDVVRINVVHTDGDVRRYISVHLYLDLVEGPCTESWQLRYSDPDDRIDMSM